MSRLHAVMAATALALSSLVAWAQGPAPEASMAIHFKDAQVKWGPCPPFLPKGCGLAVVHGDPAQDNADAFLRVPSGSVIPRHWHTSAERMVLVAGQLQVAYDGQAPMTLRPGSYAYGPAKLPHSASCAKGEDCVLFIAFEGPIDAHPMTDEGKP